MWHVHTLWYNTFNLQQTKSHIQILCLHKNRTKLAYLFTLLQNYYFTTTNWGIAVAKTIVCWLGGECHGFNFVQGEFETLTDVPLWHSLNCKLSIKNRFWESTGSWIILTTWPNKYWLVYKIWEHNTDNITQTNFDWSNKPDKSEGVKGVLYLQQTKPQEKFKLKSVQK